MGSLKGMSINNLGFTEQKGGFYAVDKLFDHSNIERFELTEERVNKLTTVVKFLEHANYKLTEKDIPKK